MPIYEYHCRKCKHDFEELVFDDTPPICPSCGAQDTQKLMSCCARYRNAGDTGYGGAAPSGGGGCAGCAGGNCASCGQ